MFVYIYFIGQRSPPFGFGFGVEKTYPLLSRFPQLSQKVFKHFMCSMYHVHLVYMITKRLGEREHPPKYIKKNHLLLLKSRTPVYMLVSVYNLITQVSTTRAKGKKRKMAGRCSSINSAKLRAWSNQI